MTLTLPLTSNRVEKVTSPTVNHRIRQKADEEVARFEGMMDSEIGAKIGDLDHEWDIERLVQAQTALAAMISLTVGLRINRRALFGTTAIYSAFLLHSLQGWSPQIPIFRRLGIRTQREIDREKYALKAIRGDFDSLEHYKDEEPNMRVSAVLYAVDL